MAVHAKPAHDVVLTGIELAVPSRRFNPSLRPAVQIVGTHEQRNRHGLRDILILPVLVLALACVGLDPAANAVATVISAHPAVEIPGHIVAPPTYVLDMARLRRAVEHIGIVLAAEL